MQSPATGAAERWTLADEGPWPGLLRAGLACAVAVRWGFLPAILLAAGPALLRALRPYAGAGDSLGLTLAAAPFLLALVYLVLLTRRALRAATTPQSRLDPDVL